MEQGQKAGWPSADALMAELRTAYPDLWVRPAQEFGDPTLTYGVWTGGEARMPNGDQIFSGLANDPDKYDGRVHVDFLKWLEQRGWYVEDYDGATFFIVTIASAQEL